MVILPLQPSVFKSGYSNKTISFDYELGNNPLPPDHQPDVKKKLNLINHIKKSKKSLILVSQM